jgi:hypothetical protein
MPTIYLTVQARDVEMYLKAGWVVVLPSRPHVVADEYRRVPLVWLCECPIREPVCEPWSD